MPVSLIAYLSTVVVFFAIDFVWLNFVAQKFYNAQMGDLLKESFNMPVAAGFYLVYIVGIVIFAINPALKSGAWTTALLYGALFGFFCYATYDLTNLSTMKGFPPLVAVVDIAWGAFITGVSATFGFYLTQLFTK
ncbi:MAG: hypothetical protein CMH25_04855 [Micavibrio sp.]|nr:hypothetical protein [Micavibrio sp.]|tara:strand:- start:975 stop:1379 length:405 start_codon:yes stop_codon:yes gene_type:complete